MDWLWLILIGLAGGILGGMGMGGGVILIPALGMFFSIEQTQAQAINLIAFIPMAIVSLVIHVKNHRIKSDGLIWIIIPACIFSLLGSILAVNLDGKVLKKIFGGFLLLLSVFQFFSDKIAEKIDKNF